MNLSLSTEQTMLLTSLDKLLASYGSPPTEEPSYVCFSQELQRDLSEGGFLGVAALDGFNTLDAALVIERVARSPWSAEVAASALLGHLFKGGLRGPVAFCEGLNKPTRYLPVARHVCVQTDKGMAFARVDQSAVESVSSVLAYPLGVLRALPQKIRIIDRTSAQRVGNRWLIAIAAEAAGLMRGALDATVDYVKQRRQFNQSVGHFQAVQHRLATCEQIVSASYYLAMRAAFTEGLADAAAASLFVQQNMRTVVYDCHQFTGAMGVTLDYPLHLWTYRLKFLQGELGGWTAQAQRLSEAQWCAAEAAQNHGETYA